MYYTSLKVGDPKGELRDWQEVCWSNKLQEFWIASPDRDAIRVCTADGLLENLHEAIYEVECSDETVMLDNRVAAAEARIIHRLNWNEVRARLLAADFAERVLTDDCDPLYHSVVDAARRLAKGAITSQELQMMKSGCLMAHDRLMDNISETYPDLAMLDAAWAAIKDEEPWMGFMSAAYEGAVAAASVGWTRAQPYHPNKQDPFHRNEKEAQIDLLMDYLYQPTDETPDTES